MDRGRRVAAVVVARMGSSRFPGKMLARLGDSTVLGTALARVRACTSIDEVVLATTEESEDDALAAHGEELGVPVVRGSSEDVVGRMSAAVASLDPPPDLIVRACADNPLAMPSVVESAIEELVETGADLITPFEHATYPFGYGFVVMTAETLRRIDRGARSAVHREHVENYCFDHPADFTIRYQVAPEELTFPELCLSLDWEADFARIRILHERMQGVPLEDQAARLIEDLRAARVFVEGRGDGEPEDADLVLATRLPDGFDPAKPRLGAVVADTFATAAGPRRGLRYADPRPPGFPAGAVFLDSAAHPERETPLAFLHRVAGAPTAKLLAAPAREVRAEEPAAAAEAKCDAGAEREGFAGPNQARFPARVVLELAASTEDDLLEHLLEELEAHPETRVSLHGGEDFDPRAAAEVIRRLGASRLVPWDGSDGAIFEEVCVAADGTLRAGTSEAELATWPSLSAFWGSPELRRARAEALNAEAREG